MTREEAKSLLPVIQAFSEGKVIQYQSNGKWCDYASTDLAFDMTPIDKSFRIKPEPKYRPFNNAEECWQEMQKHSLFGWVKLKITGKYFILKAVGDSLATVGLNNEPTDYDELFEGYTFTDGTPFGVKVNE